MINRGLMQKAAYEVWLPTLFIGALFFGFESLLAYVLPMYTDQFVESFAQIEFMRNFVKAMLGADIAQEMGPETFLAFAWVHPVVLSVVWAHGVIVCTRMPAGEIDRGTADILFGWPVGRWQILCSETVVWILAGIVLMVAGLAGNAFGSLAIEEAARPDALRRAVVIANLFCLYLLVGSFGWFAGACSDRRGWAMSSVFTFLVGMFLLNYLAELWEPAQKVAFLGPMYYYKPLDVLRTGEVPTSDMAVLCTAAAAWWILAGLVLRRRDICTL